MMAKVNIDPAFNGGNDLVAELKVKAKFLAEYIQSVCPDSDQKDRALMDLQSAQMFAVSSMFGDK